MEQNKIKLVSKIAVAVVIDISANCDILKSSVFWKIFFTGGPFFISEVGLG